MRSGALKHYHHATDAQFISVENCQIEIHSLGNFNIDQIIYSNSKRLAVTTKFRKL